MSFWNPGQQQLTIGSFIPENKAPIPFKELKWPSDFNFQGNAWRKISPTIAIRLDSGDRQEFPQDLLCYRDTSRGSKIVRNGSVYF